MLRDKTLLLRESCVSLDRSAENDGASRTLGLCGSPLSCPHRVPLPIGSKPYLELEPVATTSFLLALISFNDAGV